MDLLAENQHPLVVARLREAGFTVEFIRESSSGALDEEILARPDMGSLVLLTYDRDFGDLIFNRGFPSPAAILYTRLNRLDPERIASRLLALLDAGVPSGHMISIIGDGVRLKPFSRRSRQWLNTTTTFWSSAPGPAATSRRSARRSSG